MDNELEKNPDTAAAIQEAMDELIEYSQNPDALLDGFESSINGYSWNLYLGASSILATVTDATLEPHALIAMPLRVVEGYEEPSALALAFDSSVFSTSEMVMSAFERDFDERYGDTTSEEQRRYDDSKADIPACAKFIGSLGLLSVVANRAALIIIPACVPLVVAADTAIAASPATGGASAVPGFIVAGACAAAVLAVGWGIPVLASRYECRKFLECSGQSPTARRSTHWGANVEACGPFCGAPRDSDGNINGYCAGSSDCAAAAPGGVCPPASGATVTCPVGSCVSGGACVACGRYCTHSTATPSNGSCDSGNCWFSNSDNVCSGDLCIAGFCSTTESSADCRQIACPGGSTRSESGLRCRCPCGYTTVIDPCRPGVLIGCIPASIGGNRRQGTSGIDSDGGDVEEDDCVIKMAECGNGRCEEGEDRDNCFKDCAPAACRNTRCDKDEDCVNCPEDCGECRYCGDGDCDQDKSEYCTTCPEDCGDCACNGICEEGEENTLDCPFECP